MNSDGNEKEMSPGLRRAVLHHAGCWAVYVYSLCWNQMKQILRKLSMGIWARVHQTSADQPIHSPNVGTCLTLCPCRIQLASPRWTVTPPFLGTSRPEAPGACTRAQSHRQAGSPHMEIGDGEARGRRQRTGEEAHSGCVAPTWKGWQGGLLSSIWEGALTDTLPEEPTKVSLQRNQLWALAPHIGPHVPLVVEKNF